MRFNKQTEVNAYLLKQITLNIMIYFHEWDILPVSTSLYIFKLSWYEIT